MVAARRGTFEVGEGWVHEGKRGWRCKIGKMVDAGWIFDPSPETEDGVTCFYCNLSLDGWEPKDDPFEEHRRRSPECAFFSLVEQYHGADGEKAKGKKGGGRPSTASKGSRLSTQSALSVLSEAPSMPDVGEGGTTVDDSIMSTATTASQAKGKGKKKPGRKPAAAKAAKGRKRANTVDDEAVADTQHAELSQSQQSQPAPIETAESSALLPAEEPEPASRPARKGTIQSKQVDSSIIEVSRTDAAPKKSTRGRKPKTQLQPEPEPEPESEHETEQHLSEVSAQLQEELELSMHSEGPDHESTPHQEPAPKPKRGVKRTSEGVRKELDSSVLGVEFPAPPKVAAKGRKGRKPSKQHAPVPEIEIEPPAAEPEQDASLVEYPWMDNEAAHSEAEPEKPKKTAKPKKAPAKKGKGKKTSSARSSKATVTATEPEPSHDEPEDLERDEMEIEAELARMAAEQQTLPNSVQAEQEKAEEYEPSPSHAEKHANQIRALEAELHAEENFIPAPSVGMANYVATVAAEPLPPSPVKERVDFSGKPENATPSPSGSDKENQPSSVLQQPTTALKQQGPAPAPPLLSPTKATQRIPLAPGTPNRSPTKHNLLISPSKHFTHLQSTTPWTATADLDIALLASPQPTPGTLAQKLAGAAGALTSPEKGMTVEEWVRWRAERGEAELRRRGEEMVGGFEREGVRALECLGGVVVG